MKPPIIGLIGGSGIAQALTGEVAGDTHAIETPYGTPSSRIVRGRWEGIEVAFLARHGEGHTIPPSAVPYRANIYALKQMGVTHIIASGATGSLREEFRPRDLVVVDQVIDRTVRRRSSFFDEAGVAVHVELSEPFCPALRAHLLASGSSVDVTIHDGGTYICMEGPAFSTVAESRMHRSWGGDLIGMTAMPEAKLAREAEMCFSLIALPTDYDCWRPHDPNTDRQTLLSEIIGNLTDATRHSVELIRAALRRFADAPPKMPCACHRALDLAVWTRKDLIDPAIVRQYPALLERPMAASQ